jgi:hypothetical protein
VILNLAIWFAIHTIFGATVQVRTWPWPLMPRFCPASTLGLGSHFGIGGCDIPLQLGNDPNIGFVLRGGGGPAPSRCHLKGVPTCVTFFQSPSSAWPSCSPVQR